MITLNTFPKLPPSQEDEALDLIHEESTMSLGEFLRHKREQRGITLEQVASVTKIGIRTLNALEADHYSELPAAPFIRGFVTSYCRFIGLNSPEVLIRFNPYITMKTLTERPNREGGHSGYIFEKKNNSQQSRTVLLIAILGFVVLGGVPILLLKPLKKQPQLSFIEKLRMTHRDSDPGSGLKSQVLPVGTVVDTLKIQKPILEPILNTSSAQPALVTPLLSVPTVLPSLVAPILSPLGVPSRSPSSFLDSEFLSQSPLFPDFPPSAAGLVKGESQPPLQKSEEKTVIVQESLEDPLDSGLPLKRSEIRHKIIFKVLADIWVRYQVDQRPMRKFIIRKGNSLVLRAVDRVKVQVSNPRSVIFNYNQTHFDLMPSAFLFYPNSLSEEVKTLFTKEPPLPQTADPISVHSDLKNLE